MAGTACSLSPCELGLARVQMGKVTRRGKISSCPALCRASTSFFVAEDVDGRDEPGHDVDREFRCESISNKHGLDFPIAARTEAA